VCSSDLDEFVETFVAAAVARWPNVLLQFEDFARGNAGRLLERYRDRLCAFNDDIQGTAAVAAGALLAAVKVIGRPMAEQRIVVVGAGSAGMGISGLLLRMMVDAGLPEADARRRFFAVDRDGLLVEGMPGILRFQEPFVQPRAAVEGWSHEQPDKIALLDVVENAKPTVLIGVSGQAGIFSEEVVRAMAARTPRPIIFPLSNPTSRAEATPQEIDEWSGGRAIIGTGSPFAPILRDGRPWATDQTNNAYIFPGVGLGVLAVGARRVSDAMFTAAARALGQISPALRDPRANLLPPVHDLRAVAVTVAHAVALEARAEGQCPPFEDDALDGLIARKMWEPVYRPYRRKMTR